MGVNVKQQHTWRSQRIECPACHEITRARIDETGGIKCFKCDKYSPYGSNRSDISDNEVLSIILEHSHPSTDNIRRDFAQSLSYLEKCRECDLDDERAAIMEYDAKLSKEEVDNFLRKKRMENDFMSKYIDAEIALLRKASAFAARITELTRPTVLDEWHLGVTKSSCRFGCDYCKTAQDEAATIFWYLDHNGQIKNGKKVWFRPDGFHRIRDDDHIIHFIYPGNGIPLYGEWQLTTDEHRPFALFESEKSAIIASVALPNYVCLAVGGHELKNEKRAAVLRGRKGIILFDREPDAIIGAQEAANTLRRIGATVSVENLNDFYPGIPPNWDAADLIYEQFLEWKK
jgi:hypothetical protein